jgi:predicted glycosyltransferase
MRILIDIGHPAHVHFFKNAIWKLQSDGHEVEITAREKEITTRLLDAYGFRYHNLGKNQKGLTNKAISMIKTDLKLYKIAKNFNPDVMAGIHNPYIAHVSKILKKPSLIFTDTEHAKLASSLTFPFSTIICTPACFKSNLGKKQIRYDGYHEYSYLHPNYFKPNSLVLNKLGLQKNDQFIIVRFVAWNASHDVRDKGFNDPVKVVKSLEEFGRVIITSEKNLPIELLSYKADIPPEDMHHLLYYASLYIGESATMASESAILGTPSIFISTSRRGYTDELEEKYELVYNFSDPINGQRQALDKAIELLKTENLKTEWKRRRDLMLCGKTNVTEFIVHLVEEYSVH